MTRLWSLLVSIIALIYGFLAWVFFVILLLWTGNDSGFCEIYMNELEIARDLYWNLSKSWNDFIHDFISLRNGLKLHYVVCNGGQISPKENLFIFIHGFPDSWVLWRYILSEKKLRENAILVALDLPGYGGSDSFPSYGSAAVMEALVESIVEIRKRYNFHRASQNKNVSIIAHDWGCLLSFRLAAEAPQLADRFILGNAPFPQTLHRNGSRIVSTWRNYFIRPWLLVDTNLRNKSTTDLNHLVSLLYRLGYLFAFQLPDPFIRKLGTLSNFGFMRFIHRIALGEIDAFTTEYAVQAMAASLGPGLLACSTSTDHDETYGVTVTQRQKKAGEYFVQQTAIYRQGALFGKWDKSAETISSLEQLAENSSKHAAFTMPSTQTIRQFLPKIYFLWSRKDLLDNPIIVDGIEDLLCPGSHIVYLPSAGHWTPIDDQAKGVILKILYSVSEREESRFGKMINHVCNSAIVVSKPYC